MVVTQGKQRKDAGCRQGIGGVSYRENFLGSEGFVSQKASSSVHFGMSGSSVTSWVHFFHP